MDIDIDTDTNTNIDMETDNDNKLMLKEEINTQVDKPSFGKVIYHLNDMTIYQSEQSNDVDADVDTDADAESKLYEFSIHVTLDDYNKRFWDTFSAKILPEIHPKKAVPKTMNDVRNGKTIITFYAERVRSLQKKLEKNSKQLHYEQGAALLFHAITAVKNLEESGFGIVCFDITDFIVINKDFFLFINSNKVIELEKNNLVINEPIQKGEFPSPELNAMNSVPYKLPMQSSYFSLASFIGTVITGNRIQLNDMEGKTYSDEAVEPFIRDIYYTKVYWALKRCLDVDYNKRVLTIV